MGIITCIIIASLLVHVASWLIITSAKRQARETLAAWNAANPDMPVTVADVHKATGVRL